MDIKIDQLQQLMRTEQKAPVTQKDDTFRFTLISNIAEKELQEKLTLMMEEISVQSKRLKKHMDIRDMRRYRSLIKGFMNEVVNHSRTFTRENFLDRRGRHQVYGIIRLIDENLDILAEQLMKEEKDNILILNKVDEIRGLLLDIFT